MQRLYSALYDCPTKAVESDYVRFVNYTTDLSINFKPVIEQYELELPSGKGLVEILAATNNFGLLDFRPDAKLPSFNMRNFVASQTCYSPSQGHIDGKKWSFLARGVLAQYTANFSASCEREDAIRAAAKDVDKKTAIEWSCNFAGDGATAECRFVYAETKEASKNIKDRQGREMEEEAEEEEAKRKDTDEVKPQPDKTEPKPKPRNNKKGGDVLLSPRPKSQRNKTIERSYIPTLPKKRQYNKQKSKVIDEQDDDDNEEDDTPLKFKEPKLGSGNGPSLTSSSGIRGDQDPLSAKETIKLTPSPVDIRALIDETVKKTRNNDNQRSAAVTAAAEMQAATVEKEKLRLSELAMSTMQGKMDLMAKTLEETQASLYKSEKAAAVSEAKFTLKTDMDAVLQAARTEAFTLARETMLLSMNSTNLQTTNILSSTVAIIQVAKSDSKNESRDESVRRQEIAESKAHDEKLQSELLEVLPPLSIPPRLLSSLLAPFTSRLFFSSRPLPPSSSSFHISSIFTLVLFALMMITSVSSCFIRSRMRMQK